MSIKLHAVTQLLTEQMLQNWTTDNKMTKFNVNIDHIYLKKINSQLYKLKKVQALNRQSGIQLDKC